MTIFKLPDLGEGLPDAEISEWHVKIGDHIHLDQKLVAMETAKAVVEVPSPVSGRILKLYGNVGDIIKTGDPLVEYEADKSQSAEKEDNGTVVGKLDTSETIINEANVSSYTRSNTTIKATPAVRAMAQKLKVDLSTISGTGPNGSITMQDVNETHHTLNNVGPVEPLKGVRRAMAQAMIQAHTEVVPVTIFDDIRLFKWKENRDITVELIQAIVKAHQKEPALNIWFDGKALGRRFIKEVHLGLAMDTEDGLFVPVIRQAETLDAAQIRQQIDHFKKEVANRTISPNDLRGATITLSNFGKFGGRYANPIVVPPMVAIIGVGKLRQEVVAVDNKPEVCSVLPIALTFDHRAVTGGEATRFLAEIISRIENF